jgi:endoglucanase
MSGSFVTKWLAGALFALALLSGRAASAAAPGAGYWHTSGNKILDSNNQQVRIAGINWYGFETTDAVAHGLNSQDYKTILNTIHSNGYNTVRLPFSNQMVESPVVPGYVQYSNSGGAINTDLKGLNSLQIMDAIIEYAGQIGLRVILDDHRSEAGNSAEASGLWYTAAYPETAWIADWKALVTRYQNNATVIGVDLRNEPHNAASGGACWDCGTATNDWHLAAERAGNAVLAINPKLLVFVEGTDEYNNNYYFWGGNLQGVQTSPVVLNTANQLVYSAHDYGPAEYQQSWFNGNTSYDSLVSTWTSYWAYISLNGIAPVWVGEFGTLNDNADVQSSTAGSEGQWFSSLVQFLTANPNLSCTYWASGGTPVTTPSFTLSQSPSTVVAATSNTDLGSSGDVTEVTYTALVNNRTASDESAVTIALTLPAAAVNINAGSTGSTATCSTSSTVYSCSFPTIAAAGNGGVSFTAIYPSANLTFDSNGQSAELVSATATVGSTNLPSASVTTTVDKQSSQPNTTESIVSSATPAYSYPYGQQASVNFSLSPTPTSAIPIGSFNAQLDGTQTLTVTLVGNNSYQIPVGLLSGGSHTVAIHLVASNSYSAASSTVTLNVQKATATAAVAGAPVSGNYGTAIPITLDLSGLSGTGFASPTGTASLVIDNLAAQSATVSGGVAVFNAPASLSANTHSLNFSYPGDSNYAAQTLGSSLVVKPVSLVATGSNATRALGAANPPFTGTLTGVVAGDGITATYVSQATTSTPAGSYSTGPNAIVPVLADPNSKLGNYVVTLNDGTLTITGGTNTITFPTIPTQTYGNPAVALTATATSGQPVTYNVVSGPGVISGSTLQINGAGTISITASQPAGTGYAAASTTQSVIVNRAPLTVVVQNVSRAMNEANPVFTGTATGFVNSDTAASTGLTYTTTATQTSPVGTYPITASLTSAAAAANYLLTATPGILTVTASNSPSTLTWLEPAAIFYGTPLGPAQLNASSTTAGTFAYKPPSGTILGAGPQTLSVVFTPTSGSAETATTTLIVNQATTTTTLTAVNATTGGSITLSAIVAGINGGAVTGSVQFVDGSTSLAAVTINSTGQATYNVQLSNGPHTLTAVYSGDVNNLGSTSTALLESVTGGLNFSLSANPTMLSLNAGQSLPVQLAVFSSDGFSGTVTFKCTGLPNGSTCSFNPATITGSGSSVAATTTLTIGLPPAGSVATPAPGSGRMAGFLVIPAGLFGMYLLWQRKRLQRTLGMSILMMVFLVSVSIGCGVSTSKSGTGPSSIGSFNALITATSASSVQTLTIPVTLTQ